MLSRLLAFGLSCCLSSPVIGVAPTRAATTRMENDVHWRMSLLGGITVAAAHATVAWIPDVEKRVGALCRLARRQAQTVGPPF